MEVLELSKHKPPQAWEVQVKPRNRNDLNETNKTEAKEDCLKKKWMKKVAEGSRNVMGYLLMVNPWGSLHTYTVV